MYNVYSIETNTEGQEINNWPNINTCLMRKKLKWVGTSGVSEVPIIKKSHE